MSNILRIFIAFMVAIVAFSASCLAADRVIIGHGQYVMSKDETLDVVKKRALDVATRNAAEQISVYVEAYTHTSNGAITKDEIRTAAAANIEYLSSPIYKMKPYGNGDIEIDVTIEVSGSAKSINELQAIVQNKSLMEKYEALNNQYARVQNELSLIKKNMLTNKSYNAKPWLAKNESEYLRIRVGDLFLEPNLDYTKNVASKRDYGVNYDLLYPIVTANNATASDNINAHIREFVDSFLTDYNNGSFMRGSIGYEVKYEDDSLISINMLDYRYLGMGAAHGHTAEVGMVFDKSTGNKLPLEYFVRVTVSDLQSLVYSNLYNDSGQRIKPDPQKRVKRVPTIYFLMGNGSLGIKFGEYELAPYSAGNTYIKLDAKLVDYYNRLHH